MASGTVEVVYLKKMELAWKCYPMNKLHTSHMKFSLCAYQVVPGGGRRFKGLLMDENQLRNQPNHIILTFHLIAVESSGVLIIEFLETQQ